MADTPVPPPQPQPVDTVQPTPGPDGRVALRDAAGKVWWGKPQDVPKGIASGLRYETADEAKDRELRAWAKDHPGIAAIAAAGRTLTLGASSLIAPKAQAALAEQNPVATTGAELGSLLIPIAGELGVASKAAKIVTESRAVQQAARAVDTVARATGAPMSAVGAVGSVAGRAAQAIGARPIAQAAARFATEAELYNIGANFSEAMLGDEELTADRLLAHSGSALALGAGLGAGGHIAASAASRALAASRVALTKAKSFVRDVLPESLKTVDTAEGALQAYGDVAESLSGMPAEKARQFVDPNVPAATRKRMVTPFTEPEKGAAAADLYQHVKDTSDELYNAIKHIGYNTVVPKAVTETLTPRPFDAIRPEIVDTLQQLRGVSRTFADAPMSFDNGMVSRFNKRLDQYEEAFLGRPAQVDANGVELVAGKRGTVPDAAKAFNKLLELRRQLQDDIKFLQGKANRAAINTEERATLEQLRTAKDTVASRLRAGTTFGQAATDYALVDEMYHAYKSVLDPKSKFGKQFMSRDGERYAIDPSKFRTFMSRIHDPARGMRQNAALEEFFQAADTATTALTEVAERRNVAFDRKNIDGLLKKSRTAYEHAATRAEDNALLNANAADDTGFGTSAAARKAIRTAATLGTAGMLGGAPGVAAVAAWRLASDPVLAGKAMLTLEHLSSKVSDDTRSAIGKMLRGGRDAVRAGVPVAKRAGARAAAFATSTAKRTAAPASVGAMHAFLRGFPKDAMPKVEGNSKGDSKRLKDYRQLEALLLDLTTDPERAYDRYAQALEGFRKAAPNLTHRLITKQLEAAAFLADKLPKNPSFGKTLNDAINDWRPSDQDLAKFERYVHAAQDPLSVLDDMARGALTREGIETIQALYPALYQDIRQTTLDNIAQLQQRLPYAQRLNLSVLLNVPVDTSVTPQFVATMQGFYSGSTQDAIQGAKGGAAKAAHIKAGAFRDFNTRFQTSTQRTQFR